MEPTGFTITDGRTVVVRHIERDDYDRVLRYFDGLGETTRKYFCPHPFDDKHARMIVETSNRSDTVRLGAFADSAAGPLVGYFYYEPSETMRYPHVGCGIVDTFHDQGLGKILMNALVAEARRNGMPGLWLCVDKPNYRALHLYSKAGYRIIGGTRRPSHYDMVLDFAAEQSPFKHRCLYLHPIDWKLTNLTADTWSFEQWRDYLNLIQGVGANMVKLFIWPTQYYHPDYPETRHNRWRYELYQQVLAYARTLCLETHVGLAANAVPPSVWLAHPDKRAEEVGYRGIGLCWNRGRQQILEMAAGVVDQFADAADGFVIWYADPGLCICPQCTDYTPVMRDMMRTYEELVGDRAQVHHCAWWIGDMADGTRPPIPHTPGIRDDIFGSMSPGDWTLIHDRDEESIRVAREHGLEVISFAFFMDPESGNEANSVLPRTEFAQIEQAVRRAAEQDAGLLSYRLTPFTRLHQDWLFFRRQLHPDISRQQALGELAAFIGVGQEFVEALELLEQWWAGEEGGYDMGKLRTAADTFRRLAVERPEYLTHLSETTDILLLIADAGATNGWQVTDELVEKVQRRMEQGPTFTSFTHEQLWDHRAALFIKTRLHWWMKSIRPIARA